MVFSPLHWVPSALAALLTFALAVNDYGKPHKALGGATILLALLGFAGYIYGGNIRFFPIDFHTFHAWLGLATLTLSAFLFADKILIHQAEPEKHCRLGKLAALLAAVTLGMGLVMLLGLVPAETAAVSASVSTQELTSSHLPEVEAVEYQGVNLTPISGQGNNAIKGTQKLDRDTYRLRVTGLVGQDLNMSYDQMLELPAYSEVVIHAVRRGVGAFMPSGPVSG